MGPRMAEPSHHTLSSLERNLARRDAHAEMAFMKSDVDRLRVDAQSFQQDLQSRLRDPHSGFFRQRPTVMLVSRLVNNWPLEGKREELWQRSNKSQRMLIRYALVAKYHVRTVSQHTSVIVYWQPTLC